VSKGPRTGGFSVSQYATGKRGGLLAIAPAGVMSARMALIQIVLAPSFSLPRSPIPLVAAMLGKCRDEGLSPPACGVDQQ
jgi:hypothetical protein